MIPGGTPKVATRRGLWRRVFSNTTLACGLFAAGVGVFVFHYGLKVWLHDPGLLWRLLGPYEPEIASQNKLSEASIEAIMMEDQAVAIVAGSLVAASVALGASRWVVDRTKERELKISEDQMRFNFYKIKLAAFTSFLNTLEWYQTNAADIARFRLTVLSFPAGDSPEEFVLLKNRRWMTRKEALRTYRAKRDELNRQPSLDAATESLLAHFDENEDCSHFLSWQHEELNQRWQKQDDLKCRDCLDSNCVHTLAHAIVNDVYRLLTIDRRSFVEEPNAVQNYDNQMAEIDVLDDDVQAAERRLRAILNAGLANDRRMIFRETVMLPKIDPMATVAMAKSATVAKSSSVKASPTAQGTAATRGVSPPAAEPAPPYDASRPVALQAD